MRKAITRLRNSRELGKAVALYTSFREKKPRKIKTVSFNVPRVVAVVGYIEAIDYKTTHGKKTVLYTHDFAPGSRPLLCTSSDGKQLLLIGGRYRFTRRGIVDRDARGREIDEPQKGELIE